MAGSDRGKVVISPWGTPFIRQHESGMMGYSMGLIEQLSRIGGELPDPNNIPHERAPSCLDNGHAKLKLACDTDQP